MYPLPGTLFRKIEVLPPVNYYCFKSVGVWISFDLFKELGTLKFRGQLCMNGLIIPKKLTVFFDCTVKYLPFDAEYVGSDLTLDP